MLGQYNLNEEGTHKRYDAQELKAEYLIAHIDHAFQSWASVWNNHYDFEHFCNYVLPYRIGNEPTEAEIRMFPNLTGQYNEARLFKLWEHQQMYDISIEYYEKK